MTKACALAALVAPGAVFAAATPRFRFACRHSVEPLASSGRIH
jgi:hypothetical protein